MRNYIKNGNIFESGCEALVNPVNMVGVMGAGLARQFAARFPEMLEDYRQWCEKKHQTGDLHIFRRFIGNDDENACGRWIINFPTKIHWKDKSSLVLISAGLKSLLDFSHDNPVRSVALPGIGCGLGGLAWADVKPVVVSVLEKCEHPVEFYIYEPH